MTALQGAEAEVLTPTVRRFLRRSLFWIGITTIIVIIAVIGLIFSGSLTEDDAELAPGNAAPAGAKALIEVLGQQGVDVTATSSLAETEEAIESRDQTTLVLYDRDGILTVDQYAEAGRLADTIVLIDPSFELLDELLPEIYQAGYVEGQVDEDCDLPAAEKAGSITGDGNGFRITDGADVTACFESGDDVYSLVQVEHDGQRISALGAVEALSNGRIVENGNAALALNLLGTQQNLVWYIPGAADYEDAPLTTGDLAPAWVFPVVLVLVLSFIATALWRGRRLGPLIVENLPVTVRASETMQGRARLYQHSSARLHTLDSLRIGAIDRLARLVGLPTLATTQEVVSAVAAALGRNENEVRHLLVDAVPTTDRELIALSDHLLVLEAHVTRTLRPE